MNRKTGAALFVIAAAAFVALAAPTGAQTTTEQTVKDTTKATEPAEATETTKSEKATPAATPVEKRSLRIASWGGAYGQAQQRAIIKPAEEKLSVAIKRVELTDENPVDRDADVLELRQGALLSSCKKGELIRRNEITVAPTQDGTAPEADFLAGGLTDCGVASFAWSSLILYDRSKFQKRKPTRIADVFDVKRFKGKRAFIQKSENLLEILAVATLKGSRPETVYEDLSTRENRDRVFTRLEALLPHIVWVETPSEALAKLEKGEVIFAAGFSGRAFRKTIAGNIAAIWDGHVYDYLSWAISSQAANKEIAKKFVELATTPGLLADQAKQWPYGPMRKSAAARVGRHATLDLELAPFMPTSTIRLSQGIRRDAVFWEERGARLNDRLAALLEGFPRGVRVPPPPKKPAAPAPADPPKDDN